jgi:hypothetical protein
MLTGGRPHSPIDDIYLQFTLGNNTDGDLYNVRLA